MIKTNVVNVVATADLNQKVDLSELRRIEHIIYDSDVYGGQVAYCKSSSMEGKVSIFSSGKMISAGTTSEEKAFCELEQVVNLLVEKQIITKPALPLPLIRNIVVTADFRESIDLEEMSKECKMIYEPEQFPGGILRVEEPHKATVLVFASGKGVITGLRSSKEIAPIVNSVVTILDSVRLRTKIH